MKKSVIIALILFFSISGLGYNNSYSEQKPQYGGTLRILHDQGPSNIGFSPAMSFRDQIPGVLYAERLMDFDTKGDLQPSLAESWEASPDGRTITLHLRKGVKFHDYTDFNAEAVRWNILECLKTGAIAGGKYIASMDVVDDYTIRFNLTERNSQVIYDIWQPFMFSPTAYKQHGKDWAMTHCVSTAAFKVVDFQRDVIVKMEKFDAYWRPNRPFLDKVELRLIQEPATILALMQAKQADLWMGAVPREAAELKDLGFPVVTVPTVIDSIVPDSRNPGSKFADKRVREALEYAIDRRAFSDALGFGFTIPINQLAPPNTAGYNPDYKGRPYDPEKARRLLAQAGYPGGFTTKMTLLPNALDMGVVIKNDLAEVGIDVRLDVAEPERYWGAISADGWDGLLLGVSAINPEYCVAFLHYFGPEPLVKFVSLAKSPQYLEACNKVIKAPDIPTMREMTKYMVTQASEDAMAIPLQSHRGVSVFQDYVHTTYCTAIDWTGWTIWNDWLSKK